MLSNYHPTLTFERISELLAYDAELGTIRWRVAKPPKIKPGDDAGAYDANGYIVIGIDGQLYSAGRVAWFLSKGSWPLSNVYFKDGNRSNLRENNLVTRKQTYSNSYAARYQRERRAMDKRVMERIRTSPDLAAEYMLSTNGVEDTKAKVRQIIRREDARHTNGID